MNIFSDSMSMFIEYLAWDQQCQFSLVPNGCPIQLKHEENIHDLDWVEKKDLTRKEKTINSKLSYYNV